MSGDYSGGAGWRLDALESTTLCRTSLLPLIENHTGVHPSHRISSKRGLLLPIAAVGLIKGRKGIALRRKSLRRENRKRYSVQSLDFTAICAQGLTRRGAHGGRRHHAAAAGPSCAARRRLPYTSKPPVFVVVVGGGEDLTQSPGGGRSSGARACEQQNDNKNRGAPAPQHELVR